MDESSPGRIFISYRRQETAWPARQLYDVLVDHFPAEQVFKDVDNIEPGDDFNELITAAVASCDVLLALIGPQWLTITDENNQRRLNDPSDWVRLEIEAALTRKIRVIPILVDDARMPHANELPPSLAPLVRRNAVEISPISFDTKRLVATVRRTLADVKAETATGAQSPRSTPRADHSSQQVAGHEVEQLYDRALAAFWTERWDEAVDLLGQVLGQQPDYADAARKLQLARRQQQLEGHYAQAAAAADAGDWEQAISEYTMIRDSDSDYRDTNARLAEARHQQQHANLLAEARRLHRAGQWAAVIKVGEQLQAIEPAAADPDGLISSARTELAIERQAARLAAEYHSALRLFDASQWEQAIETFEHITQLDPEYKDAAELLNRARRELEQAAALAEEQARLEAEEHARVEAEEQARRDAEEQPAQRRKEPRKSGRWLIGPILAVLLVAVTVIVLAVNGREAAQRSGEAAQSSGEAAQSSKEAAESSKEAAANISTARAQITQWANDMIRLDREADERNTTQITVLAEQAYSYINLHGQDQLQLAPSTYRVLATYTTLTTDNRSLAQKFGDAAVAVAVQQGNTLEEIRARRALAELAAKNGDIAEMRKQVDKALDLANPPADLVGGQVLRNSKSFTGSFAVYSALWAKMYGGAGPEACAAAEDYFAVFGKTIANYAASKSLEVSRRAYRLGSAPNAVAVCGLDPQDDLHLAKFTAAWLNNPDRK